MSFPTMTPCFTLEHIQPIAAKETLIDLQFQINHTNARYAQTLNDGNFNAWPNFFIENARYKIQARENHARGLPLCIVDLESQGMMKDRIYGITQTIFHAPYYTRHVIGQALILGSQDAGELNQMLQMNLNPSTLFVSSSNYCVFRTKPGQSSEVFNVGQYLDHWVQTPEGLKIASRHCIYDSEMILNSLIYPI
jgi:salicylate 5-hydroxylase small subunit